MKKWTLFIVAVCLLSITSIESKATTGSTSVVINEKVLVVGHEVAFDEGAGPALVKRI
ncbi:MAG: hypothetical protein ACXVDJ_05060 [Tumebacillaceae bacterium]